MQIDVKIIENFPIIFIIHDYGVHKNVILSQEFEKTHFHSIQRKFQTKIYFGMTK
jgi:hypothetical protein